MTEKRFIDDGYEAIEEQSFTDTETDKTYYVDYFDEIIDLLNELDSENKALKQQRIDLLRLIENNIEIYENINTNVEFHQGEIQGKLTVLHNLRKVMLND